MNIDVVNFFGFFSKILKNNPTKYFNRGKSGGKKKYYLLVKQRKAIVS